MYVFLLHLGVRPFQCTMCDKTYGRRDYLQRHLKSHNANFTANLSSAGGGNMSAGPIAKAIKMGSGGQNQQIQVVQVPQSKYCASWFYLHRLRPGYKVYVEVEFLHCVRNTVISIW